MATAHPGRAGIGAPSARGTAAEVGVPRSPAVMSMIVERSRFTRSVCASVVSAGGAKRWRRWAGRELPAIFVQVAVRSVDVDGDGGFVHGTEPD